MALTVRTGNKSVEQNPFPPPEDSGFYFLQITRVSEKPIKADDRIMRVALNLKCLTDAYGEKAAGFVSWSTNNIPADLEEEFEKYNPALQQRRMRNALRIVAEVDEDTLDAGEVEVNFEDWKDVKVWAYVTVKDDTYQGERRRIGEVNRFCTHDEVLRQTGQITEEEQPLEEQVEGATDEVAQGEGEGEVQDDDIPQMDDEPEDDIPEVAPPAARTAGTTRPSTPAPAAQKAQQGAANSATRPAATANKPRK